MSNHVVIVTGSRDWDDWDFIETKLEELDPYEVVEGGASGADEIAREWANRKGIDSYTFNADWRRHGKAAGPIRNRYMLETYKNDIRGVEVVAFRKNNSRGTTSCVEIAKMLGMKVTVYDR